MIITTDRHISIFIEIIDRFLNHEMICDKFCSLFVESWIMLRDEHLKARESIKKTWDRPYDLDLMYAKLEGRITAEEFQEKNAALWEIEETTDFDNMIHGIHSLCTSFREQPKQEWEVDENTLRSEVSSLLQVYKSSSE
jgi:hypothetical protein